MCWNAEVSLNTFIFSSFVLAFVYYNNEYTQYKIPIFENKWLYIFLILTFSMQLIEFFIWRNLKNNYNQFFTKIAFILVYLQAAASLMLLSNLTLRNSIIIPYLVIGIPYLTTLLSSNKVNSSVSKTGHIVWNNFNIIVNGVKLNNYLFFVWLFLLLFSFLYEQRWYYLLFAIVTISVFLYKEMSRAGSMWCWFINIFFIYLMFHVLIYLPFCERKTLC